jgi:oxygen-independent coproporphyrinogen III oxidase
MKPYGIYIHVPFCRRKCSYCSFYSESRDQNTIKEYGEALLSELEIRTSGKRVRTVYVGGGTPTLLPAQYWSRLLTNLRDTTDTSEALELTIETNPGTVTESGFAALRKAGFNRLSIGVQSFNDSRLQLLTRIHTSDQANEAFRGARNAGFENISVDLMYGIPGQTLTDWCADLEHVISLFPEHLSCYELSVIEGTPVADSMNRGLFIKPDEETCREMYFRADEILSGEDYIHYEVSNYARGNDFVSKHNSSYWDRTPYTGLGPSAHSFDGESTRRWNVSSIDEYINRINEGLSAIADSESVTREQSALEIVMLGLRCRKGFDFEELEKRTGICISMQYLDSMIRCNRVTVSGTSVIPTPEGMLYADGDCVELLSENRTQFD